MQQTFAANALDSLGGFIQPKEMSLPLVIPALKITISHTARASPLTQVTTTPLGKPPQPSSTNSSKRAITDPQFQ
jgi:hypothetical protein